MKAKPTNHRRAVLLELGRRDEPLMAAAAMATSRFKLKKILVPVDFSECAKKALRYAIPLAKEHGAAITLLYVVPPNQALGEYGGIAYTSMEAEMRASGEKQLAQLVRDEVGCEVPAATIVRKGSPALEIVDAATSLAADLIVISTHGRTGLKHVFLGSVAEHVMRRAPCPVLVVREEERDFLAA